MIFSCRYIRLFGDRSYTIGDNLGDGYYVSSIVVENDYILIKGMAQYIQPPHEKIFTVAKGDFISCDVELIDR